MLEIIYQTAGITAMFMLTMLVSRYIFLLPPIKNWFYQWSYLVMAWLLCNGVCFFAGATPENNYTPTTPWTVRVHANPYSFQNEGWAILYLKSGGGDNERGIKLRQKPSTGQWFLNDIQCLSDIRLPASENKWR